MKRWFKRIFVAGFVLMTGFTLVFFFYPFDIEEQDYSHLKRELKDIPKEENALYEYLAIHEQLKAKGGIPDFYKETNLVENSDFDEFNDEGEDVVEDYNEALKEIDLTFPIEDEMEETFDKPYDRMLKFSTDNDELYIRLSKANELQYQEGELDFKVENSYNTLSAKRTVSQMMALTYKISHNTTFIYEQKVFTDKIHKSVNSLISCLVNMACYQNYAENFSLALNRQDLSLTQKLLIEDDLFGQHFSDALDGEKAFLLNKFGSLIEDFKEESPVLTWLMANSEYFYQENRFFRDYFQFLDELKFKSNELYQKKEVKEETLWQYILPQGTNKVLIKMMMPGMEKSRWKAFEQISINKVLRTALACRLYEKDHGSLPKSLNDLVPKYLSKVPMDNFSGKSLRYDFETKKIYSVGRDGVDDGGSMDENRYYGRPNPAHLSSCKDIVFQFAE